MNRKHDALYALWNTYLHMRAWGSEHYAQLDETQREDFTKLVRDGDLFAYVEYRKSELLQTGLDVPDNWLHPLCAGRLKLGESLPESDRIILGRIISEMYPRMMRIEHQPIAGAAKWATVTQAATMTGIPKSTINRLCKDRDSGVVWSGEGSDRRIDVNSLIPHREKRDRENF